MNEKTENYIVKEFELELLSPKIRKSPERLNELLADDFFEFNQSGGTSTKKVLWRDYQNVPKKDFLFVIMKKKFYPQM